MDDVSLTPTIQQTKPRCAACYNFVLDNDVFCNSCGYPLQGTELEQKTFIAEKNNREIELEAHNKAIKTAAGALYWVAGIFVVSGIILYAINAEANGGTVGLAINIVLAFIFFALALFSKSKPVVSLIIGLALYGLVILLNAIADPLTIVQGIIVKIFVVVYLVRGLRSAMESEKLSKENQ